MEFMVKSKFGLLQFCLFAALAGCGKTDFPTTYKVNGTVTVQGKAVEGALVTFVPTDGQKVALGSTDADGQFKLSTFSPSDGAQAGGYRITVTKLSVPATGSPPPLPPGVLADGNITESYAPPKGKEGVKGKSKNLLPEKYASESSSGLVATVAENDKNRFQFEL